MNNREDDTVFNISVFHFSDLNNIVLFFKDNFFLRCIVT